MIDRRQFLGLSAGAGASLMLTPALLRGLQKANGKLLQRAIPSTGEKLPAVSFSPQEEADDATMREILETLADNGGKVVDILHGGAERAAHAAAQGLGIQNKFFWTTTLPAMVRVLPGYEGPPPKRDAAGMRAAMDSNLARFKIPRFDLVMVGAGPDAQSHLALVKEMKKEGRVRYIGVHDLATPPYPPDDAFARLESIMRSEPIDFVATDYAVGWRGVEQKILPLALERKIAFMAYFPFDRARFFKRASSMPLPEWAAEFDAKTWPQFCLKYVLSHPAVIVARTGTTKAAHMLDNLGGGIGRLPDEAMRKRMAEFVDALPPTPAPGPPKPAQQQAPEQAPGIELSAAVLDRYVGAYEFAEAGQIVTVRRDGDKLLMKVDNAPETPIVARSETRFGAPWTGATIEFQLDKGKVTGAVVEMPWGSIPLERK